jgi:phage-related protein
MTDIGRNIVVGLWNGIASLIGWLGSNVSSIIGTISNAIGSFYNSAYNIGRNLIIGMWDGIASLIGWLRDKVSGFAGGLVKSITGFFGIHSPSRLMATAVGIPLAQGIGVGFAAAMPGVASSMLAQLDGLTRGAPSGVAALSGALQGRQGGSGGAPTVAVYIGSEQLTDIVRTEIRRSDDELATTLSGRMR